MEEAVLLAVKMEEGARGAVPLEARKGQKVFSPEPPEGPALPHLCLDP